MAEELTARQQTVDATVTEWPEVRAKPVFGHRGYVHNGKMFGFMADGGVAVKVRAGQDADELYGLDGVHAFAHSGMEMRAWPVLPLRTEDEMEQALTALHSAFERATST
ncbi:MAG: hypothetical protein U1E26_00625 [Coriobacteriia bacterium]|nr:hypothetical protein [Coriobacteriia bacterium]